MNDVSTTSAPAITLAPHHLILVPSGFDPIPLPVVDCLGGVDPRSAFKLVGGEASGKRRLRRFIYGYEDGPRSLTISHPASDAANGAAAPLEDPSPPFQHYTDSRCVSKLSVTRFEARVHELRPRVGRRVQSVI